MPYFQHPLDVNWILRKKKSIKKDLLINDNLIDKNITILGGSTTLEIKNILEIFLLSNNIKPNFYESEYNKYYENSLFGSYELDRFDPDIIYIHTTNKNIIKYSNIKDSFQDVEDLLSNEISIYKQI